MKKKIFQGILLLTLVVAGFSVAYAWGVWGHKHISRAAVFGLPEAMRPFYYNHIDFITESAVVPDLRKYVINDKVEGPRHYVDIEDFNLPIAELPATTAAAYKKYDSAFLFRTGYLPWYIQNLTAKLTEAFKKKNKSEILFVSAELSHYIADACMPLHTSSNHNGQKTNQKGVHALWESMLPQMFGSAYNFKVADAKLIPDITKETWNIIAQSHGRLDSLLAAENRVRSRFTKDNMYKKDAQGNPVLFYNAPVFSDEYAQQFHTELNGMVEQQLKLAIQSISSFWYTAWVNAGQPDLRSLDDPNLFKQNRKNYKKELKAYNKGRLLNLSIERE
jgi:hypothetical protein